MSSSRRLASSFCQLWSVQSLVSHRFQHSLSPVGGSFLDKLFGNLPLNSKALIPRGNSRAICLTWLLLSSCWGTPSLASLMAGSRISLMDSLPEPNSSIVLSHPAAAPGTVTEFKSVKGICQRKKVSLSKHIWNESHSITGYALWTEIL